MRMFAKHMLAGFYSRVCRREVSIQPLFNELKINNSLKSGKSVLWPANNPGAAIKN
jgi:hypothetical protein